MHIAYKKGEPAKPTKLTKKEKLKKFAEALERKWRARDEDKAIKIYEERIRKLGMTPEQFRREFLGSDSYPSSKNSSTK